MSAMDVMFDVYELSDFAILNIKGSDYGYIISGISKNEAPNLMQNTDLIKKAEHYKI